MNVINVKVDFENGICEQEGIACITGDFNSTKIVFDFVGEPEGTKVFELKDPKNNIVFVDEIIDNEVVLVGTREVPTEQEEQEQESETETEIASIFTEAGDYVFEVSLYTNDSKLTSVCDYITVKPEQVVVDGEAVEGSITLFDNLMQDLNEAITETNNLDIDVEKVEHTTTVTITKKDGSQETVEINDGETPDLSNYYTKEETYSKGEVDNLIPDLTDYVKNTDYARTSKAGVIKSGYYGLQVDSNNGKAYCDVYTYANYGNVDNQRFISKGTLENVITGKDLTTKAYVDSIVGDIESILETLDVGSGVNGN